jgi:L-amino acid N-acyltransferase YncA
MPKPTHGNGKAAGAPRVAAPHIRRAAEADLPAMIDIYNQAVALKGATADLTPVRVADRYRWFAEHTPERYPIWVAERGGRMLGWCSLSAYRPGRMALRHTAEISYYIAEDSRRQGVGTALVQFAIDQCERLDIKTLFALLVEINTPSIRLLEKFGFTRWGLMPKAVDFGGEECGHAIYGKRVRP